MSVIISFPDGADWFKSNWIFRLAEDIAVTFPAKSGLHSRMEAAEAIGGLFLEKMDVDALLETIEAIRCVAQETIDGRIAGWKRTHPRDDRGQSMYIDSMKELLELIQKQDRLR